MFGRRECKDQMAATWLKNYIPAVVQTTHTGTSSDIGWNLLGKKDPEGFSLKVKCVPVIKRFSRQLMKLLSGFIC